MKTESSQANLSALPDAWIEKLFQRFEDYFGAKWAAQYGSFPRERVKRTWAEELSGFADKPEAIGAALKQVGTFPPTLPEFVAMCRDAAKRFTASSQALPHRLTPEEQQKADEAARKIAQQAKAVTSSTVTRDNKAWAKAINERFLKRDKTLFSAQIDSAKSALGRLWQARAA